MSIKIIIADDHQLFREGIVKLLSNSNNIEVIAEAEDGKNAIEVVRKHNPDIILMDIGMPIMNGIEATRVIKKEFPEIKIIALSMHADKQYIRDFLDAGASGYLLKSCTYEQLTKAINYVFEGGSYLSEKVTETLIQDYLGNKEEVKNSEELLSAREFEILKLYAEGESTREIADLLFISAKTVATHKQNILKKLDLKTSTDMVKHALKEGLISI